MSKNLITPLLIKFFFMERTRIKLLSFHLLSNMSNRYKYSRITFLIIVFSAYAFYSTGQRITGTITNGAGDKFVKFRYLEGLASKEDSAKVNSNGVFIKDFRLPEACYLLLTYSSFRKRIYVFPGGKLNIGFDATNDSTFQKSFMVKGDYFINRYLDTITYVHYNFIRDRVIIEQPIDAFRPVLKAFRIFSDSLRRSFFSNVGRNKPITALNNFLTTDSINWYSYSILAANDYVGIIKAGNKELFRKEEIVKRLIYEAPGTYLASEYYRRLWFFFLKGEFESQLKHADSLQVGKMGFSDFALQYLQSKNIKGRLKELIVSQLLTDILEIYAYRTVEQNKPYDNLVVTLKKIISDKAFITEFNQKYSDQKKVLFSRQIGKRAPDFSLLDTAGKTYSLDDFEGKLLLVDVWASWCGPCIKEFPYLGELEQKLKGNKNFQLLSVSTDDSKQLWVKNGILRFKPPGLGLWVGKEKLFSSAYNIDLIPVLMLLDSNGKFIDFNPPRASDGDKLYKLILKRLEN